MLVEFDKEADVIPEIKEYDYLLTLVFEQYDGNKLTTSPNVNTNNSCFTVSSDGILEGYDYNCGLDVVVPASVDGINIKTIDTNSFSSTSDARSRLNYSKFTEFIVFSTDESSTYYLDVVKNEDAFDKVVYYKISNNNILQKESEGHVFRVGELDEVYIYTYSCAFGIDSEGNFELEEPEYLGYQYYSPSEFYVVKDEEAYQAAVKYATSAGIDTSLIYIDGATNIPRDTYKVKLIDAINGTTTAVQVANDGTFYTDGTTLINKLSSLITKLDLSNSICLEEILTDTQFNFLQEVKLPEFGILTTIGKKAFAAADITEITIPSTVKSIGDEAFSYCYLLEKIYMQPYSKSVTLGENWNGGASTHWING